MFKQQREDLLQLQRMNKKMERHNLIIKEGVSKREIFETLKKIYPVFFLAGVQINGTVYSINQYGSVVENGDIDSHVPRMYSYGTMRDWITALIKRNKWLIEISEKLDFLDEMEEMLSRDEISDRFIFYSSNEDKFKEVQAILHSQVEQRKQEFVEIQGSISDIVLNKVNQIEIKKDEIAIVDDAGLGFLALGGAPGPYIKDFLDRVGLENVSSVLDKLKDDRIRLYHSMGFSGHDKKGHKISVVMDVVCNAIWTGNEIAGFNYNGFVRYNNMGLNHIPYQQRMRSILLYWLTHVYGRRFYGDDVILDLTLLQGIEPNPGPSLDPIAIGILVVILYVMCFSFVIFCFVRYSYGKLQMFIPLERITITEKYPYYYKHDDLVESGVEPNPGPFDVYVFINVMCVVLNALITYSLIGYLLGSDTVIRFNVRFRDLVDYMEHEW